MPTYSIGCSNNHFLDMRTTKYWQFMLCLAEGNEVRSGDLGGHHLDFWFGEDVAVDEDWTVLDEAGQRHQVVLGVPVAADQSALEVEVEVVQTDLPSREDVPHQRLPALGRGQQVLIVGGDCAVGQIVFEETPRVGLRQSQLIADEFVVPDEVVAGLHNQVVLAEDADGQNEIVFHFFGADQTSEGEFVPAEVVDAHLAEGIAHHEVAAFAHRHCGRVDLACTSGEIVDEYFLGDDCVLFVGLALPQSDVAVVAAGKDVEHLLERLVDECDRVDGGRVHALAHDEGLALVFVDELPTVLWQVEHPHDVV